MQAMGAMLEYRNVLRPEPDHPRALRRLGFAHFQLGEMGQAFRVLLRAQALEPSSVEVRIKLTTICLVGGRAQEARAQAEAARATQVYRRLPARPGAPAPTASRPGHRHHGEEADGEDP